MDIKEEIHALSEEMLTNLGRLVAIDSQLGTPSEGKPFGEGPAKALEEGLKIAEELGFKTVNLNNYCGYAEMGDGDDIVGIAGHLRIEDKTLLAAQSGVTNDIPEGSVFMGAPAFDVSKYRKCYVLFRKLPELYGQLRDLEKEIQTLKSKQ